MPEAVGQDTDSVADGLGDGVSDRDVGMNSSFAQVADVGEERLGTSGAVGADEDAGAVAVGVGDLGECGREFDVLHDIGFPQPSRVRTSSCVRPEPRTPLPFGPAGASGQGRQVDEAAHAVGVSPRPARRTWLRSEMPSREHTGVSTPSS